MMTDDDTRKIELELSPRKFSFLFLLYINVQLFLSPLISLPLSICICLCLYASVIRVELIGLGFTLFMNGIDSWAFCLLHLALLLCLPFFSSSFFVLAPLLRRNLLSCFFSISILFPSSNQLPALCLPWIQSCSFTSWGTSELDFLRSSQVCDKSQGFRAAKFIIFPQESVLLGRWKLLPLSSDQPGPLLSCWAQVLECL